MRPRFAVLEALDGVGKTTLALGLARHLGGVSMNTLGEALRAVSPAVLGGLGDEQQALLLVLRDARDAQLGRWGGHGVPGQSDRNPAGGGLPRVLPCRHLRGSRSSVAVRSGRSI
jgi:hypothetical protein